MLEQTRKREQILLRQNQTREETKAATDNLEEWIVAAEQVVAGSEETMLPLNSKLVSDASRLTQWSLERLEQQRKLHETLCKERLAQGEELFNHMNECFHSFVQAWPEISETEDPSSESELVICGREVVSRVENLRQRYNVSALNSSQ